MKREIQKIIFEAAKSLGWNIKQKDILVEYPPRSDMGDYTTNVAFGLAKILKKSPCEIAEVLAGAISSDKIDRAEAVRPGYVNIFLRPETLQAAVKEIVKQGKEYGKNKIYAGKKIMVEYTDPNPFKVFHIGHLMTNIIGESLSRLFEMSGAEVRRANYQGDVGLHVAKALWGAMHMGEKVPGVDASSRNVAEFFGWAYTFGSNAYEENDTAKEEIQEINVKVYDKSDEKINTLYTFGRKKTLEHFEEIYNALGTTFDYYFFESETAKPGMKLVERGLREGIFTESGGAVVYSGEQDGLHTRVFLNAKGLPTYEAKDLGLIQKKWEAYRFDQSFSITAVEQDAYFQVVFAVARRLMPELAQRMYHIGHGMMRFASGKMSSRKGNIISGESLLHDTVNNAKEKVQSKDLQEEQRGFIAEQVGVGALKYSILKQSIGKDIIFDAEQSLALEGNSGPYLQYATVRAQSVLRKAKEENVTFTESSDFSVDPSARGVELLLIRFPDIVEHAASEHAPHLVCEYLFSLAQEFNAFYAENSIVGSGEYAPYRVMLTSAVSQVLQNGLQILGIQVPEKM